MDTWIIISTKVCIIILSITTIIGIFGLLDVHLDMDIAQIIGIGDQDHIWGELLHLEDLIDLEESIEEIATIAMIEGHLEITTQIEHQICQGVFKTEDLAQHHHQEATWLYQDKAAQIEALEMVAILETLEQEALEAEDKYKQA